MTHSPWDGVVALVTAPFPAFLIVLAVSTVAWTSYIERSKS